MEALLQNYSEQERTAYLGAIASLASADRSASEQEVQFLTALAASAQLSPEATQQVIGAANDASNASIAQHLDVLKNSELKYSLVADIISFAKADGQYSPEERQMLEKMAAYLGVNAEQVQTLDRVVEQTSQQPPVQDEAQANSLFGGSGGGGIGDMLRKVNIPTGALAKGMLGILAPILISRMMSRGGGGGMMGGMTGGGGGMTGGGGGMGGMGGGLLGALGGLLGGGLLSGAMGGGGGGLGGLMGGMMGGGGASRPNLGGGLGSLMGVLGGLGGQPGYGGLRRGGLGSVLGGLLGGRM